MPSSTWVATSSGCQIQRPFVVMPSLLCRVAGGEDTADGACGPGQDGRRWLARPIAHGSRSPYNADIVNLAGAQTMLSHATIEGEWWPAMGIAFAAPHRGVGARGWGTWTGKGW